MYVYPYLSFVINGFDPSPMSIRRQWMTRWLTCAPIRAPGQASAGERSHPSFMLRNGAWRSCNSHVERCEPWSKDGIGEYDHPTIIRDFRYIYNIIIYIIIIYIIYNNIYIYITVYYIILYYTILYYIILYCIILYYIILYYIILYYICVCIRPNSWPWHMR